MTDRDSPRAARRGIYLLPNLLTTGGMFAGFYAIIAAIEGQFVHAAVAVFVAALFDSMDGRVARMTGTQTDFGVQYDSLADMVSFSLAPAIVMYCWTLDGLRQIGPGWGKLGWAAAFLYAACGALRLARFNTQAGVADKRWFQGLASPAAAGLLMAGVWSATKHGVQGDEVMYMAPLLVVITGLLMVSRVRYFSFKSWPSNGRVSFVVTLAAVTVFALLAVKPALVLLVTLTGYVLSGPIHTLYGISRHKRFRRGLARKD